MCYGRIILTLLTLSALGGCGGDSKKSVAAGSDSKDKQQTINKTPVKTEGSGLAFLPMEFGPYLVDDLTVSGGAHISLEAGYTDIRQQKDGDVEDIFDFRLKSVAVASSASHIPAQKSSGCAPAQAKTYSAGSISTAKIAGFYDGSLSLKSGAANAVDRKGSSAFKTDKGLSAVFTQGSTEIATPAELKIPKAGSIQFAQAFDMSVTVNLMISDVNQNLEKSNQDLLIGDVGNGADYNFVVVTFYGGTASKLSYVRCYIQKGDMATFSKDQYKDILPIKGITGNFVQVDVSELEGHILWRATYAGQGSEDLFIE